MRDVFSLIWLALIELFRSRASLQVEILTLRHQLNVLRRKSPQRLTFTGIDRLVLAGLYRLAPGVLDALKIVRPETVIAGIVPVSERIGAGNQDPAVNKHRRRTPGYMRANPLIEFVNLAFNRGPDRRRSGPYPERISSCYIKALRSSELGSRFGAYSQAKALLAA
jgi:hypothetical protein